MKKNAKTEALIFDFRCYPKALVKEVLATYLLKKRTKMANAKLMDLENPGDMRQMKMDSYWLDWSYLGSNEKIKL